MTEGSPQEPQAPSVCEVCARRERARARLREHFRTAYEDAATALLQRCVGGGSESGTDARSFWT